MLLLLQLSLNGFLIVRQLIVTVVINRSPSSIENITADYAARFFAIIVAKRQSLDWITKKLQCASATIVTV
jgi:hypothetical protein